MTDNVSYDVFSAMQTGTPYKKYKKTILGKVYLEVLNTFTGNPEGLILHGNPAKNQEGCFVEVWSEKEDVFLKRRNSGHFKQGTLQVWNKKPSEKKDKLYSEYSDDDVKKIVNSRFLALQSTLNKAKSEAFVLRILNMARELEKSEKIIRAIEARLSEIQNPVRE
jgi:hypothetical protein